MENKQKLQTLYDQVRDLGVVKTQYEFGVLCGRDKSWLSSCKANDRDASVGALLILVRNLDRMQETAIEKSRRADARNLVSEIWSRIDQRALSKKHQDVNN